MLATVPDTTRLVAQRFRTYAALSIATLCDNSDEKTGSNRFDKRKEARILDRPVYRLTANRVCSKCIVENFTGQYRLDGLALGLARQQRFPLPGRCTSCRRELSRAFRIELLRSRERERERERITMRHDYSLRARTPYQVRCNIPLIRLSLAAF